MTETQAIERKQAKRWHDWQRPIPTPLMDDVLALGPNAIPNRDEWKHLLRVAALTDTHLRRAGSAGDLPNTHVAFLEAYQDLRRRYLRQ